MKIWPLSSRRATGEDLAVSHLGLEGWRAPFLEGLGGLHIIVAVDQDGRRIPSSTTPFPDYYRVFGRFKQLYVEPRPRQVFGQPGRGSASVTVVLALGADGGNAEEVEQLALEALFFLCGVPQRVAHAR